MTHSDPKIGACRASLFPWAIVRLLPNLQRITVARFRRRNEAEGYLQVLRSLVPNAQFVIAFEVTKFKAQT